MPALAAAELEPQLPVRDVELVVHGDDLLRRHLVELGQRRRPGRRTGSCRSAAWRARAAGAARRRAGPRRPRRPPGGAGRTSRRSGSASRSATMKPDVVPVARRTPARGCPGRRPATARRVMLHRRGSPPAYAQGRAPGRAAQATRQARCVLGRCGGRPRLAGGLALGGLGASAASPRRPRPRAASAVGAPRDHRDDQVSGRRPARRPPAASRSPAVTCEPASRPSIETSRWSGSAVASAMTDERVVLGA